MAGECCCPQCGCEMLEIPPEDPPRWLRFWQCPRDGYQILQLLGHVEHITVELLIGDD